MKRPLAGITQERAVVLSKVHLTRRPDVRIFHETHDGDTAAYDLLVSITDELEQASGVFAVVALGSYDRKREKAMLAQARERVQRLKAMTIPLCHFYFTMEDDRGYFTWMYEPAIADDGTGIVRVNEALHLEPLDNVPLDTIVQAVKQWYRQSYLGTHRLFQEATETPGFLSYLLSADGK